jgi:hypothetical protein
MTVTLMAWIVGGFGLLISVFGAFVQPDSFAHAWLAALTVWARWPLGCLALLLIHALTGGRWGYAVRPYLIQGIGGLPLLLPAVIPLLFLLPHLYPWMRAGAAATLVNGFYLNPGFAALRWVIYLVVWFGLGAATFFRARRNHSLAPVAAPGLILLVLTVNFASIDAIMSLDPAFNSSAFGMISIAESILFALSITMLAAVLNGQVAPAERDDLGRLLQSVLILWAYLDFMQLLIVWQSDLPNEAAWYLARSSGFWGMMAWLTAIAHFLLPFVVLLFPQLRRSRQGLIGVTGVLVVMTVARGWWLVLPAHEPTVGWIDVAAVAAFAGVSVGLMLRGASSSRGIIHA